jgi:hypothetical protein
MGKDVIQTLADNLANNIGKGHRFEKIVELGARAKVGKSSIDRIKKKEAKARIDSVELIAKAYGLEAWQFLVPDLDVDNPPKLFGEDLTPTERELLTLFVKLTESERAGLLANARAAVSSREGQDPKSPRAANS